MRNMKLRSCWCVEEPEKDYDLPPLTGESPSVLVISAYLYSTRRLLSLDVEG